MSEEPVEQITKVPSELEAQDTKKEKDPKKVAAGKKLAEYHKKIKAAYDREKTAEAEAKNTFRGWLSIQSIAIGALILGATAYNLYFQYRDKNNPSVYSYPPPPPPPYTPEVKTSKIGMQ